VARAKQTARADARRRARLANRVVETEPDFDADEEAPTRTPKASDVPSGRPGRPGLRGFTSAFRASYRPPNVRADIAALPPLLLGRSFLAAIGLVLVGAIGFALYPGYSGSTFLFQFLTFPPAMAPIFLAGFFAPRASYILGFIVGVFDALVYAALLLTVAPSLGLAPDQSLLAGYVLTSLFWSAVTGVLFAAGAAWYRRFLQLTSPRRQAAARNQPSRGRQQANAARRR
jgi:hypothetical protein